MIDPRRLETFRVVATAGSVTAAARALHLSQPAVTGQIRQLESECGRPLFARSARGMALNAAGLALLARARAIHDLLDEASLAVQVDASLTGVLELAASTTNAAYVVPQLLAGFVRAHPTVGVRMHVGNSDHVLDAVRRGNVPFGLVEGLTRAAGVRLARYLDDPLIAVCAAAPGAAGALGALTTVRDLDRVPILWREPGSGTRAVVERALRAVKRRARSGDLELGSTEAIKEAAARGLGIAFVSRWSVQAELASGRLRAVALRGLAISRTLSWVMPSEEPGGLAGRFIRFARDAPPAIAPVA
jgi:DNA-binding transcriptional LysR family regulator